MKNENKEILLELKHISKRFGSVQANHDVSLELRKGEILSLLGENGSGKTSLMNVLAGIYTADEGDILIEGKKVQIFSPHDAYRYRIGMVHQHFKLVDTFTAVENVVLGLNKDDYAEFRRTAMESEEEKFKKIRESGREPNQSEIDNYKRLMKSTKGFNIQESATRIKRICDKYGFNVDPFRYVHDMAISEKQTLEIVKSLYRGVDILILDEPTAVLTPQETERLFDVLRAMKENGKSIIIITHKLNEVMEISDRVTVLRKGKLIGTIETKKTNISELTDMMVGKKVKLDIQRDKPVNCKPLLDVSNLNTYDIYGKNILKDVTFSLQSGEILGIAGIAGSGQKELLEAIAGLERGVKGEVIFHNPKKDKPVSLFHKSLEEIRKLANEGAFHYPDGKPVDVTNVKNNDLKKLVNDGQIIFNDDEDMDLKNKNPLEIRQLGIHLSFVPEDRLGMGLVGSMSLTENMLLRSYRKGKGPLLNLHSPEVLAKKIVEELEVSTPSTKTKVKQLSGGNVQKVLLGREIAYAPKVLMVAYPVRGLDINSSYTIYNLLNEQKKKGVGVIYVGEDLDVLLSLADRIVVLCGGKVSGIVDARKVTKQQIGALMVGDKL